MTDATAQVPVPVPARPPGRPRSTEADQAILDAATELFGECGFEGLSVEEVAAKAGCSKATIYRRYPSKADLVIDATRCLVAQRMQPPDTGNVRDDLRELLQLVVKTLKATPAGRVLPVMVAETRRNPELASAYKRFTAERRALSRTLIRRGIERGELRADTEVDLMADMLVGPIFHRYLVAREPISDAHADKVVDAVLRAFSAH